MNSRNRQTEDRPVFPAGIYGILGEKFSRGRTNVEIVRQMAAAGVGILQYREKAHLMSRKTMLEECCEIRKITQDAGVVFIVNDFLDIALLSGADGVHVGQDDLPVTEIRKLAPHLMVGCSTHSPDQAQKAILAGADYIGVGPIFATKTKDDVCAPVGLTYLDWVLSS